MSRSRWVALGALLVLACSTVAPQRPGRGPTAEDARGLDRSRAEFVAALVAGDAAALAAVFTEDAVLMNPRMADVRGRASILSLYTSAFGAVSIPEISFLPVETEVFGERAYERTTFVQRVEWRDGKRPPARDEGRALFVWSREPDGRWRIHRVIVNTTLRDSPLH